MRYNVRMTLRSRCVAAIAAALFMFAPLVSSAQSASETQLQIASLLKQLIELETKLINLLGTVPGVQTTPVFPVSGGITFPQAAAFQPVSSSTSISSMILKSLPSFVQKPLSSDSGLSVDEILFGSSATQEAAEQILVPSCVYYEQKFPEGAKTTGDACPGSHCPGVQGPTLICNAKVWYYQTGSSVCEAPGFILDTPAQRAYRIALGCKS